MKASELRKIYIAIARLYGFMYSQELFLLLDHYGIKYKKADIYKDLSSRLGKFTHRYCIERMKRNEYLILDDYLDTDSFDALFQLKAGKPTYYPPTYEDFLNYSISTYVDENEKAAFQGICDALLKRVKDQSKAELITTIIMYRFEFYDIHSVLEYLEEINDIFKDVDDMMKFLKTFQKHANNIRLRSNNGFTPLEMRDISGPIDPNNIVLTIGPNMRNSFLMGEMDAYEYLKEVEESSISRKAKESLSNELKAIIKEIEENKA